MKISKLFSYRRKITPILLLLISITLSLISFKYLLDENVFNSMLFLYLSLYPALGGIYLITYSPKKFDSSIAHILLFPICMIVLLGILYLAVFSGIYGIMIPLEYLLHLQVPPLESLLFLFIFVTTALIVALILERAKMIKEF